MKTLSKRRKVMFREYQARHYAWVQTYLPCMPEAQWQEYLLWVAAYVPPRRRELHWAHHVRKRTFEWRFGQWPKPRHARV